MNAMFDKEFTYVMAFFLNTLIWITSMNYIWHLGSRSRKSRKSLYPSHVPSISPEFISSQINIFQYSIVQYNTVI